MAFVFLPILAAVSLAGGCARFGPVPETVPQVDLDRYVGLWHEISSNPVFFNRDLVAVTAEYAKRDDGRIGVINTGYKGTPEGKRSQVTGKATVVDTESNARLSVQFDFPFGFLFRGSYLIVLLDTEEYQYAVVTDDRQGTLFVLCRTPEMDAGLYAEILEALAAKGVDTARLRVTGGLRGAV